MAVPLRRVLISDDVDEVCARLLQAHGIEVVQETRLSKEQLLAEIPVCALTRVSYY